MEPKKVCQGCRGLGDCPRCRRETGLQEHCSLCGRDGCCPMCGGSGHSNEPLGISITLPVAFQDAVIGMAVVSLGVVITRAWEGECYESDEGEEVIRLRLRAISLAANRNVDEEYLEATIVDDGDAWEAVSSATMAAAAVRRQELGGGDAWDALADAARSAVSRRERPIAEKETT